MLEMAAAEGDLDLFYLDESGFCQWSCPGYSYYYTGQQKRQEQTQSRGNRLSILGIWQPLFTFVYSLVIGSFKSHDYVTMLNAQAEEASVEYRRTGKIRVIVQDNGSTHTSKLAQQHWTRWEEQGLYLFFLPPYCSEMNRIEIEWLHAKRDQLCEKMFDSEPELAYNVICGLEERGCKNGHSVQYVDILALHAATCTC